MSKDARFDEEIVADVERYAKSLIEHKEIRSVAIVIDWNLPTETTLQLPSGAFVQKKGTNVLESVMGMQIQLPKMANQLSNLLIESLRIVMEDAAKQKKTEDTHESE